MLGAIVCMSAKFLNIFVDAPVTILMKDFDYLFDPSTLRIFLFRGVQNANCGPKEADDYVQHHRAHRYSVQQRTHHDLVQQHHAHRHR